MTTQQDFEAFFTEAEDHISVARAEAREMLERADEANGWGGALVAAWDQRCEAEAAERVQGAMMRMASALADKLAE